MSNLTDFFPSGGGGGLTPKFQEFNASGTFTPSQALIDAGGYIEVFLVAGGGSPTAQTNSAGGGETQIIKMYLTSINSCAVTIGSGGVSGGGAGGNSIFAGSSAGGIDVTSTGGAANSQGYNYNQLSPSWSGGRFANNANTVASGGAGTGINGYGAGGYNLYYASTGVYFGKQNSGQASTFNVAGASGYCLIKWYE